MITETDINHEISPQTSDKSLLPNFALSQNVYFFYFLGWKMNTFFLCNASGSLYATH